MIRFDHVRGPFVAADGPITSVDAGLFHTLRSMKRLGLRKSRNRGENYVVERMIQNAPNWIRTAYRWPSTHTPEIQTLLDELFQTTNQD